MTFGSTFGRTFSPTFQPKSQAAAAASTFVPTDITGLAQWLDFSDANTLYTDAGTTKVSSDGDAIYQANDKSGNNKHATQTTAGYRPLYKTGIQNSKSIARFDGSDDYLLPNTNEIEGSAWTLFIAFKGSNSAGLYIAGRYDVTFSSKYGCGCAIYNGKYGIASISNSGLQYLVTNTTYTNWNIATFKAKTSENEMFVNGASIGTDSSTPTPYAGYTPSIGRYVGTGATFGHPLNGDIGEIVLYNSGLSTTDIGKVNLYLNNKWAIY